MKNQKSYTVTLLPDAVLRAGDELTGRDRVYIRTVRPKDRYVGRKLRDVARAKLRDKVETSGPVFGALRTVPSPLLVRHVDGDPKYGRPGGFTHVKWRDSEADWRAVEQPSGLWLPSFSMLQCDANEKNGLLTFPHEYKGGMPGEKEGAPVAKHGSFLSEELWRWKRGEIDCGSSDMAIHVRRIVKGEGGLMSQADEPAFPVPCSQPYGDGLLAVGGLTKRELFAAMAMQGFSANPEMFDYKFSRVARISVDQADALIAELEKEPGS